MDLFRELEFSDKVANKFKPLVQYLTNIDMDDLECLDTDDFIDAARNEDKLLMQRFALYVKDYYEMRRAYESICRVMFRPGVKKYELQPAKCLVIPANLTVDLLIEIIDLICRSDMTYQIIDLNENISGTKVEAVARIRDLVDSGKAKFIDVTGVPFQKETIQSLIPSGRLIWIKKPSVNSFKWTAISGDFPTEPIFELHKAYYYLLKDFRTRRW